MAVRPDSFAFFLYISSASRCYSCRVTRRGAAAPVSLADRPTPGQQCPAVSALLVRRSIRAARSSNQHPCRKVAAGKVGILALRADYRRLSIPRVYTRSAAAQSRPRR